MTKNLSRRSRYRSYNGVDIFPFLLFFATPRNPTQLHATPKCNTQPQKATRNPDATPQLHATRNSVLRVGLVGFGLLGGGSPRSPNAARTPGAARTEMRGLGGAPSLPVTHKKVHPLVQGLAPGETNNCAWESFYDSLLRTCRLPVYCTVRFNLWQASCASHFLPSGEGTLFILQPCCKDCIVLRSRP